jgi:pimeloyl-ACP methyl ester carboxylesterase
MIRHTANIMGHETAYWERNPNESQTIVMLHGFRGNHKGLVDLMQYFDGYRILAPDLPGYGESEALEVPHTLSNYALWLDNFIKTLKLGNWISWSHSYSSSISLIQAVEGEFKPQIMISVSMAAVRRDLASWVSTLYYRLGTYMPPRLQQRWISSRLIDHTTGRWLFLTTSTQHRKALQAQAERDLPMLNARVVTEEYMSALDTPLEAYATRVRIPVLVIAGARDVIVPLTRLERLVTMMPDGTIVVLADQGHLAPIERPGATATASKQFITSLQASSYTGFVIDPAN